MTHQDYTEAVAQAARDAHARMMREPHRLWLYFKPHGMTFATAHEGEPEPEGFEIVTPEPMPRDRDVTGLTAWVRALAGRLPLYPKED